MTQSPVGLSSVPGFVYDDAYLMVWPGHVFPTGKYRAIRDRIARLGLVKEGDFVSPTPASWEDLRCVHTEPFLTRIQRIMEEAPMAGYAEFEGPCTPGVVDSFLAMTGGTMAATGMALESGAAMNLGGGFHHAFAEHGEGFCLFNDVAVAIRQGMARGDFARPAVVDLDVHQGNGTAHIFLGEPDVFTFSMHQEHNYPVKQPSDLDIGLEDRCDDEFYLAALKTGLAQTLLRHKPDIVYYLAGADPYREDQLGGLSLTLEGLEARDEYVFDTVKAENIPIVVTLAGGYARKTDDVTTIHTNTARMLVETHRNRRSAVHA